MMIYANYNNNDKHGQTILLNFKVDPIISLFLAKEYQGYKRFLGSQ